MFGFTPMIPEVSGTPPVRVVQRRNDSWGHQMCCIGWIKHPEHGDIFYILNSWGKELHGVPAGSFNEPPGGFWIKKKEMLFLSFKGFQLKPYLGISKGLLYGLGFSSRKTWITRLYYNPFTFWIMEKHCVGWIKYFYAYYRKAYLFFRKA
jgi:hypothetical protein